MRHAAFMCKLPSPAPLHQSSATDPPLRCFSVSVDPYSAWYLVKSQARFCFALCAPLFPSRSFLFVGCETLLITSIDSKPPLPKHLPTSKL
ncbi:hypothetical protein Bca4012_094763 [Brassica carinata]